MPRRYSFDDDDDTAEREPLGNPQRQYTRGRNPLQYQQQEPYYDQQPPQQHHTARSAPTRPGYGPGAHPDSAFNRIAASRRNSRGEPSQAPYLATGAATGAAVSASRSREPTASAAAPQPPPHRGVDERHWRQDPGYTHSAAGQRLPLSNTTPGADNFSEAAAGGMAGIAYTVAERNARESGVEAMSGPQHPPQPGYPQQTYQDHWQNQSHGREQDPYDQPPQGLQAGGSRGTDRTTHSSQGLGAAAVPPAHGSPGMRTPSRSPHHPGNDIYTDDPYSAYSRGRDPRLGHVNPNEIEDDGDEGLEYGRRGPRTSMLSLGTHSNRSGGAAAAAAGATGGAVAGATLGGLAGRAAANRNGAHGQYDPVANGNTSYQGADSAYDWGNNRGEKSEWLAKQGRGSKKWMWIIIIAVAVVVAAAIACGVVFGVVLKNKNKSTAAGGGDSSQTAAGDTAANGDLSIDSPEIQGLLNNKDLHKIFPGIDYTPVNTQYPDCVANPPSQNNVTRDIAVLSQLTNTIRLYGTDCNQTEMTIHAVRQLKLQDTVKIWMGVWQDNNKTTNARQLDQMWKIFDSYGADPFKGVIVANEILFREQMTAYELGQLLTSVRTNMTSKGISLPVATSDLGDKWDSTLADVSDYIMANIHPFFGGIPANEAADWTWVFWEGKSGSFFKSDKSKNIISETGWPSRGGTDCGATATGDCANGAVAGIDQMNQFMSDWVCEALNNGTEYFWFEAFDEPWKVRFNEPEKKKEWEDQWGLMDVNRNLKEGVKIPDCGGKTV